MMVENYPLEIEWFPLQIFPAVSAMHAEITDLIIIVNVNWTTATI